MRRLLLFACALFGFMACTQNPIEEQSAIRTDAPETIRVGFEDDETRIQLNEAQKTVWTKDDLVSVFYLSNANQKWQYQGETGERIGNLQRVEDATATAQTSKVVVVYPYRDDHYLNYESCNLHATLPTTQYYAEGSYGVGSNLMVSQSEFTQFSLKSVCGWLKLQLTGNGEVVKSIKFRGNNGEQVAGLIYVDTATAEATLASEMGGTDDNNAGGNLVFDDTILTEVVLDCGEGVTLGTEATSFYISLPPQTFENGFTVEIESDGYKPMTLSTENELVIERNTIQPMAKVAFCSEVRTIANNEIWYTATKRIEPDWTFDTFGANVISSEWNSYTGKGIITFDCDITIIGSRAFYKNENLQSVTFNNNLTTIDSRAFEGCSSLTNVTIPGNIQEVGYLAFADCTNVSSIILETGDTELWISYSFDNIPSTTLYVDRDLGGGYNYSPFEHVGISTITIGPNMKYIDTFVFANCNHIQGFNISSGSKLEKIGYCAFYNSNINGLRIPGSVTEIDSTAFAMTTGMGWFMGGSSVYWVGMNGELAYEEASLRILLRWPSEFSYSDAIVSSYYYDKIGAYSFAGIDNLRYFQIAMYDGSTIELDDCAFWHCENLESFKGVVAAGAKMNISAIGSTVFGYTAIEELNFLDSSFTSIDRTFRQCITLKTLFLPKTLSQIGECSFEDCENLTNLYIAAIIPPSLSEDAFKGICEEVVIYVPAESVDTYKSADGWKDYANAIIGYNF